MARQQYEKEGLFGDDESSYTPDAGSSVSTVPGIPPEVSNQEGSTDRPRNVPGPGREEPVTPVDVQPRQPKPAPAGPPSDTGGGGSEGAGYTPVRPKAPTPIASQPPAPFSPLAPMMDPGAMTVAMRAPSMPSPTAQYGMDPGGGKFFGGAQGLTGGGLGLPGAGEGFQDTEGGDDLDMLIRLLMQGGGGL